MTPWQTWTMSMLAVEHDSFKTAEEHSRNCDSKHRRSPNPVTLTPTSHGSESQ
ncbi:hypothetical protein Mapa_015642 [Marchantia paleacea]|nr:hypothetical protein Mapa_015642 [Marchantia paleacea]